ncbi:uncharacterized protein J3R85_006078 [Psidium guajava]|nr:uncharacterized protein J3R85_006078 [Psidium guajava]
MSTSCHDIKISFPLNTTIYEEKSRVTKLNLMDSTKTKYDEQPLILFLEIITSRSHEIALNLSGINLSFKSFCLDSPCSIDDEVEEEYPSRDSPRNS